MSYSEAMNTILCCMEHGNKLCLKSEWSDLHFMTSVWIKTEELGTEKRLKWRLKDKVVIACDDTDSKQRIEMRTYI